MEALPEIVRLKMSPGAPAVATYPLAKFRNATSVSLIRKVRSTNFSIVTFTEIVSYSSDTVTPSGNKAGTLTVFSKPPDWSFNPLISIGITISESDSIFFSLPAIWISCGRHSVSTYSYPAAGVPVTLTLTGIVLFSKTFARTLILF